MKTKQQVQDRSVLLSVRWPSPEHVEELRRFADSIDESVSLFLRRSAAERMARLREQ